jgi:LuxR family transcriptional regulator, maltose regulon positive regulatory protein
MVPPPLVPPRIPAGKAAVPELPAEFVPRPRLRTSLDAAPADQVVVVSAPAGSGKTLLLADWVRATEDRPTAWVSLDRDDNDLRRLWTAVVTSVLALPRAGRDPRLQRVARAAALRADGDVIEQLADALDGLGSPVRLVLDDVHELTEPAALGGLTRMIHRRPSALHLVLSSRADPPISVPRLRLEGRLHEMRAADLRFTLEDTAALMTASGLALTPAEVSVLHTRTEGWVAGLRLAALALRRSEDTTAFLTTFSGDERSVAEYLTSEVVDGLDGDTQDFLRRVSVCTPLPAALATALSDEPAAGWVLDRLGRTTALIERTSRGDYRIHPLLRTFLMADLLRHQPGTYRELHAVAARWWSGRDEPVHALRHAERAGDSRLITDLVHRSGVGLLLSGQQGPLRRALAAAGADARLADPWLALLSAISHLEEGADPSAIAELRSARGAWPDPPGDGLEALQGSAELLATAAGIARDGAPDTLPDPERTTPELAALVHASRAAAEFGNPQGADVGRAQSELERTLELAQAHGFGYLEVQSLWMLATLGLMRGDLRGMATCAERAVAVALRLGRHPSPWSAGPMGLLAYADLLGGDPAAAAARAAEALGTWDPLPPPAAYTLQAVHGAALADQGQRAAGLTEMRDARAELGATQAPPSVVTALAVLEHRVALANGNLAAASAVAAWLVDRAPDAGENLLLQAWTEMARGRFDAARTIVTPLLGPGSPALLSHTGAEAHLIEAEAALDAGDQPAGRTALDAALARAELAGVTRPLALAGPHTKELLTSVLARNGPSPFAARVAAARAAVVPAPTFLLSEREMAVLALLPSLLNAREIADEFTVSVNTVKSHIRSIYAKMGVSSRRDAVAQAQESGLLQ